MFKITRKSDRIKRLKHKSVKDYKKSVKDNSQMSETHKKGWQYLALQDLLKVRDANNGISRRGDIKKVVKYYNEELGYKFITKGTMNYSVLKHNLLIKKNLPKTITATNQSQVSPITDDQYMPISFIDSVEVLDSANTVASNQNEELVAEEEHEQFNAGGRKKGSTIMKKREDKSILAQARTEASELCFMEFVDAHELNAIFHAILIKI